MLRGLVERQSSDSPTSSSSSTFQTLIPTCKATQTSGLAHYISQLWPRKKRVELIRHVDRMLVILLEEAFIESISQRRLRRTPSCRGSSVRYELPEARNYFELQPDAKVLALLPGSRRKEVERLLPTMLETFQRLRLQIPTYRLNSNCTAAARSLAARPGTGRVYQGWSSFKSKRQRSYAPQMQRLSAQEPPRLTALLRHPWSSSTGSRLWLTLQS